MKKNYSGMAFLVLILLLLGGWYYFSGENNADKPGQAEPDTSKTSAASASGTQLLFSDTQTLGSQYSTFTFRPPEPISDFLAEFTLDPVPPAAEIDAEIEYMLDLQQNRTEAQEAEIVAELALENFDFGEFELEELTETKPQTWALLDQYLFSLDYAIFHFKTGLDRVRPSFYDSRIKPSIPVPDHPAYPSRHSTQAHFVAYILGNLHPEQSDEYETNALRIAQNREVAGVHYPSDTSAGIALATAYFAFLQNDELFMTKLEDVRSSEW